jgi:hypothetical protein
MSKHDAAVVGPGLGQRQHLGPVGRAPAKAGPDPLAFVAEPAPEDEGLEAEAAQDLRQLRRVAEAVRQVAHLRGCRAVAVADRTAVQQVAHERLPADQELIRKHVAWSGLEPAAREQRAEAAFHLRADLEVVLDHDRLAVEREAKLRPRLERLDHLVHHLRQADPEVLERHVPLTIPVGVRSDPEAPGPRVEQRGGERVHLPADQALKVRYCSLTECLQAPGPGKA